MKKYLKVFGIVSGISGILLIGVITAYFLLNRYPKQCYRRNKKFKKRRTFSV